MRLGHPMKVSVEFLQRSSRLLLWSMFPLAAGISIDFYLIARIILEAQAPSLLAAIVLFAGLCALWSLLPRWQARRS